MSGGRFALLNRRDVVSSLFWMGIGVGVCAQGYELEIGTARDPGSGFVIFWVGAVMIGLALIVLLGALREKGAAGLWTLWAEVRWKKLVSVVAALCLYAYAFNGLGFIIATILLLIFLFKAIEPQRWSVALLGAVVCALTAYLVFQVWLGSQLPRGILDIG